MIELKNSEEIEKMRAAGKIVAKVLATMQVEAVPGVSTWQLDQIAEEIIRGCGAVPSFLGYGGFPGSICASINEEVVHGIPSKNRILKEGDIVGIDVGAYLNGFHADSALTVPVGKVSSEASRLLTLTKKSLNKALELIKPGIHLGDVQHAVETYATAGGFGIVRDYCGHGVGRKLHEDPSIPNFGNKGTGPVLKEGMTLAIEPMLNLGGDDVEVLDNNWTVVTTDGSYSAHFEHTVAVTQKGYLILTA
ncbi:MAG: type I methionyl aminopeptidase [Elusimicrobiota bacterium]|jgi:methionyl aminopeptidase|nr:type I methionyl aminopeptidase [Elusimicrobiota bacterium]